MHLPTRPLLQPDLTRRARFRCRQAIAKGLCNREPELSNWLTNPSILSHMLLDPTFCATARCTRSVDAANPSAVGTGSTNIKNAVDPRLIILQRICGLQTPVIYLGLVMSVSAAKALPPAPDRTNREAPTLLSAQSQQRDRSWCRAPDTG